jgi:hypothetical protein
MLFLVGIRKSFLNKNFTICLGLGLIKISKWKLGSCHLYDLSVFGLHFKGIEVGFDG